MDAVIRAAHPLAPTINAAFDRGLTYADLAAMLAPGPSPRPRIEVAADQLWTDLVFLYELGIEQAEDAEAGRKLMLELARLCLDQLGDPSAAEIHLRRVLATDPAHSEALDEYVRILLEAEHFEEAAELLEDAIDAATDDDKPDLFIEFASVVYLHLHQTDRAVRALFAAHEHDNSRIDALARARVILVEQARWVDVKRVLDEETAHVLAWGGEEDDVALRSLAEAYRLLGDRSCELRPKLAEECFRRATFFGDERARERNQMLDRVHAGWSSEAERCRREGFEIRDRGIAAILHLRAAGLALECGKDYEAAEISVDRSWLLDPTHLEAVELIESAYAAQERLRELPAKLDSMAKTSRDRSLKIEILLRAARMAERFEDALPWYRRILTVSASNEVALLEIDRILEQRGRQQERAEILEGRLPHASGRLGKRIRLRLGRIYTEKLGDYERAIEHLNQVLAWDQTNFEAASMLRAIYRDIGDEERLTGVVDVLIEYCPDRKSRQELLAEQGVRGRRFRKCGPNRARRTRPQADTSCMGSVRGDNLAADGRKRRAEEERPVS